MTPAWVKYNNYIKNTKMRQPKYHYYLTVSDKKMVLRAFNEQMSKQELECYMHYYIGFHPADRLRIDTNGDIKKIGKKKVIANTDEIELKLNALRVAWKLKNS